MRATQTGTVGPAFGVARSLTGRRWVLRDAGDDAVHALLHVRDMPHVLARLLAARGTGPGEIEDMLNPTLRRLLPEPSRLNDMDKAATRLKDAIMRGERIAIFGDYDVDGSCAAALLHDFLAAVGVATRIYVPDRMREGYGPSEAALRRLQAEGASIVVTVDCGATASGPLQAARAAGLDVVVLDHHATEAPLPALAHVNPNAGSDSSGLHQLCATGVAFLFAVALNRMLRPWYEARGIREPDLMTYVDLVGLATVCDVVPLTGVNRAFVRAGLARLDRMQRPGLAALADCAGCTAPFSTYHLGFVLGPRINAGGRVGRCGLGVDLLTARDGAAAREFALALDAHNRERQAIEKLMLDEATAMASQQDNRPFLFVAQEGWHAGVVGIIAGRLKDRFGKPALVTGFEGGLGRGSARSVPGADIGAVVRAAKEAGLIDSGGGHAMAAGFSLVAEQSARFQEFLAEQAPRWIGDARDPLLEIDAPVSASGATAELVESIALAGPFGAGNPEPLVAVTDARIAFADIVGRDHVRVRLAGGDGARLDAIAFRVADQPLGKGLLQSRGKPVHLAGRLKLDEWNGRTRVQLHVEDAAPAGG